MDYYLSIDIGSTSGRHIVGWFEDGEIRQDEVYRFSNGPEKKDGHLIWNLDRLFGEVKTGIRCAFEKYPVIRSLSIDTWGSDYVLMNGDQEILPSFTYRDSRTNQSSKEVHDIVPFDEIYERTGYQYGPYNAIYHLYSDKTMGRLEHATDFLLMPEYLLYKLSGVKKKEATNNSTTSLVDPRTGKFDLELTRKLGLPDHLFTDLAAPGTYLGPLLPEIAEEVGGTCNVILCATHDTESAISVIPMEQDQIYISSGTWSLLGVRLDEPIVTPEGAKAGFSNEGGLDYICYLTNIPGMWVAEQLRSNLCPGESFNVIVPQAEASGYKHLINPYDPAFTAPESMTQAFCDYLTAKGCPAPETTGDFFSCAYHSLAFCYKQAIDSLEKVTGQSYEKIYITGGGSKNKFLNRLTEEYTGKKVIPYPIEASTAGSILIQMKADRVSE